MRSAVDRLPVSVGGRGLRYARWAKRFLTFADLPEEPTFRRSYTLYDPDELAGLRRPRPRPARGRGDRRSTSAIYDDNSLPDHVNRMCLADARLFLPGLNLAYTDRASMAASVEVRVPFVDPVVARAAFSIPGADEDQAASRARSRSSEPPRTGCRREIVYRPKASFSAPLRAWVRHDLRELIHDVLVDGELDESGLIRRDAVLTLIDDEQAGREDHAKQIWQLLSLELWYRTRRGPWASRQADERTKRT